MNDEPTDNGHGNGRDHDDDGAFDRSEAPTKVETESGRSTKRIFTAIGDRLDDVADALGGLASVRARLSPARWEQFLRTLIARLRNTGDVFHALARDHEALLMREIERKDDR